MRCRDLLPLLLASQITVGCLDWPEDLLRTDQGVPRDAAATDGRDAGDCPSGCTNNCANGICRLSCTSGCTCPAGWQCEVSCLFRNACPETIDCSAGTACTIDCSGDDACASEILCPDQGDCTVTCGIDGCTGGISCGAGRCDVECSKFTQCIGTVDCSQSCACSVESFTGTVLCPSFCAAGCTPQDQCDECP